MSKEQFTPAERAWLDKAKANWQPLSEPQVSLVRRHFGPVARSAHPQAGAA